MLIHDSRILSIAIWEVAISKVAYNFCLFWVGALAFAVGEIIKAIVIHFSSKTGSNFYCKKKKLIKKNDGNENFPVKNVGWFDMLVTIHEKQIKIQGKMNHFFVNRIKINTHAFTIRNCKPCSEKYRGKKISLSPTNQKSS